MDKAFLWFVKITGWPLQHFYFKKKIYTEDNNKDLLKLKGSALIVSNHTSVYDYPLIMYTFLKRSIRVLVAEVIYKKGFLMSRLMHHMGAIRVDRNSYDFGWASKMVECLNKGYVGLIFPESRIPEGEERLDLIEFKPSYVYVALESGVPIIPVYTNGIYGKLKKEKNDVARIMVGKPINVRSLFDEAKSEKENIDYINQYVKTRVKELRSKLENEQVLNNE